MKRFLGRFQPPPAWRVPVVILLAITGGLVFYLFVVSRAHSYLSDDPQACVNCHIMAPQYATWAHSSHRERAHCNDCHVPHDNFLVKYYFKAKDGLRHATIFTLRKEPQVIFIREEGREVVQDNCILCHSNLVTDDTLMAYNPRFHGASMERECWECHRETPHGRVNSLSSVPYARVPVTGSAVPGWMRRLMETEKDD
ncbi:MAG: cytochrome c nitrite reductase small subunit [Bacteroidetes bacterium]|nr:MAG: cytochrome c nitrite reductase small subunit [Bacteroidota bacterium]